MISLVDLLSRPCKLPPITHIADGMPTITLALAPDDNINLLHTANPRMPCNEDASSCFKANSVDFPNYYLHADKNINDNPPKNNNTINQSLIDRLNSSNDQNTDIDNVDINDEIDYHKINQSNNENIDSQNLNKNQAKESGQYTLIDDLSIIRAIASYYGMHFSGKIPWSFWQTYKRATKSDRSTSSLYHHWSGVMQKKYGGFIAAGKISDCIAWLEAASGYKSSSSHTHQQSSIPKFSSNSSHNSLHSLNSNHLMYAHSNSTNSYDFDHSQSQYINSIEPAGLPLIQQHSQPPIEIQYDEKIVREGRSCLVRTSSYRTNPFRKPI
ncbi:hypothetical protein TRFO_01801 [Tritrichomonas foetus]|uniref:Uncharacterized protein n=1 Tax=Tritrichomonas foetus TaxID=1144522 RepID=A0A1J4JNC9_9EUKA|nr:hypothetical protein TRFO_01801 [Tritrichomonas foetus]|eukprot:OHS98764.1 hypothetical protein TRFO_01801 [Tritrichomonas foetus]